MQRFQVIAKKQTGMKLTLPKKSSVAIGLLIILMSAFLDSCLHEPFIDPSSLNGGEPSTPGCVYDGNVCFESSVLPIFQSSCAMTGCHNSVSHIEGYALDSYANIVRRGITPGNASQSKLYKVLFASGEDRMPPNGSLTQAQKDSIKIWINQGAKNTTNCNCNCDDTQFTYVAIIQPIMNTNCVGCHKPGSLGGNIDLSTYAKVNIQVTNGKLLGSVTHASGYVAMPQGGKLEDCQISQIQKWIDAGALNN
jgi:Cytochrome C oxidase, cbb3-type, subunit III/Planctomycete cytochrome C